MPPWIDQLLVGLLVGGAVGFFAHRLFRRGKRGCGSGCGCAGKKR